MLTHFGKQVQIAMLGKEMALKDLSAIMSDTYGKSYNVTYLSAILHGARVSEQAVERIASVLDMEVSSDAEA